MNNECFDLTSSAFHILKVNYDSDRSDIAELVDDAEFDEIFDPAQIQRAQQSLLTPMTRLEQELSWLPELSQTQVSGVFDLIKSGDEVKLTEASVYFPELAKANVLAHLCGVGDVTDDLIHSMAKAWDEIDSTHTYNAINNSRAKSGFPSIDEQQFLNALKDLESRHASTAAIGLWRLHRPGEAMERIVEAELKRSPSSTFLERFVRSYDNLSEIDLVRISDDIDGCIDRVKANNESLSILVAKIADLLVKWDDINQPVQFYEQQQGHEEGRSKRIYEKLWGLCLELANDRREFSEARRLSEALLRTFPELESVAEVLKGDVAQLETLDEQQKQHQHVEPLIAACEAAKTQLPKVKKTLARNGFSQTSKGPISDILAAFKAALSAMADKSIAFVVVRDLALYINNDRNDPETAFGLVDGLLSYAGARPSKELSEKLEEERAVLHRNWKMNELDKNAGNLTAMLQTVDDMLKYARGSERSELQQLKSKIERKRLGKKLKWGVYASIVAVIGFFVIGSMGQISHTQKDGHSRPASRTTYQPSTPRVATPTQTPTPPPTTTQETMPPVGQGLALNRSQVRYCVFQGQRLDAIRSLTSTNYQIDRFNRLIDDFNTRCSNYRYRSGVLSSIQREARENASELQADARKTVASW